MNAVLQQQLDYANNSELSVIVNEQYSWVSMTAADEELCFLQGEEAEQFIEKVTTLYNKEGNITFNQAAMICGYPYLDLND